MKPDHLFHPSWFKAPRASKNRIDYACSIEGAKASTWARDAAWGVWAALLIILVAAVAHWVAS
jgi:hypothetical protein